MNRIQPSLTQLFYFRCTSCWHVTHLCPVGLLDTGRPLCTNEGCDSFESEMDFADCCDSCRKVLEEKDISGGRCTGCYTMITSKDAI
jgi:hypothetical protein